MYRKLSLTEPILPILRLDFGLDRAGARRDIDNVYIDARNGPVRLVQQHKPKLLFIILKSYDMNRRCVLARCID
jgi:hypothetical protein